MRIAHWLAIVVLYLLLGSCVSQDLDAPQFSQPFYEITVEENIKIGLTLFSVTVTNKDPGEITFTLNDTTNFIITRRGDVEYYGGLDYEKPELREITLSITATDSGSPPKSTSIPLYINVTNINDESPKCAEPMYQGEVMNGAPAGTEVLQVVGVDKDVNTQLTYNLTVPNSYFEVNRLTGVITTSQVVDIAAILDGRFETFRVRVSDGLRNNLCPVMLTINDPNFHVPKFSKTVYQSSLDEGSGAEREWVLNVTATDEDIGGQKILTYSLVPTMYSDNFEIDSASGEIRFMGSIDRENMTSPAMVTLIVEAVDSGSPPTTASATVNILINDVDDNGPMFSTNYYELSLPKKFPRDLKITSLPKAVDADLGENAVVSYDLSSEGLMVFDVDKSTGDITTKISCSQTCILSNDTQFEFRLFAYNEADRSIDGDFVSIRIRLVETLSTTQSSITTQKQGDTTQKRDDTTQNPGGSTQNPGGTTQKPGGTTQNPVGTTKSPGVTTQKQSARTQKPGGTTLKPGGTTQKPGETTQKLGGTTQKPSGTTVKPGVTTQKQSVTTQKPGGTTQKPDGTTQNPGGTTQKPGGTTQMPSGTTVKPEGTTQKPMGSTQKPGHTTQKPGGTTKITVGSTQKPGDSTQKSGGTTKTPVGTTQKTVSSSHKPGVSTQKPGGTTQKPSGTTQKPDGSTQKSDGRTQRPGDTTQKSRGTTHKRDETTQKPDGSTQKADGTTQEPSGSTRNPNNTTQRSGGTTHRQSNITQKPSGTTLNPGLTTQKPVGTTQKPKGTTQKSGDTTKRPGDTTHMPAGTTQKPGTKGPKFSSDLYEFDMVKSFPENLKITLLPKAVDPDENAVISYNLSADGLTVFDIDKATGDITTKISCNQACILTNSTQFEFQLLAHNEGNPSVESDSILIRIRLVERLTPTPTPPRANRPTTGALPARAGSPDDLSVGEVVAVVVVVCLFFFLIFVVILVLLIRRSQVQRKKDRIDFNPSKHSVRKIENEVP